MSLSTRAVCIIGVILLGLNLYRNEVRMDNIEAKVDNLNRIIQTNEQVNYTKNDVDCLTKNIYYEAGVEDKVGKFAVAHITLNRVKAGHWGKTICKVVYAPKQFSWTLQKKLPKPNAQLWAESHQVALQVLKGKRVESLNKSLYYHADYIKQPFWVDKTQYAATIGQHIFYNKAKNSVVEI